MGLKWSNFARAKLATPPSGTGGLSFTVEAGKGALFPALSAGDYFYAVLKNADKSVSEVVKVEARSTDAFTIATGGRGLDGTTAQSWTANDYVELCPTRIAFLEVFNAAVVAIGAVTPAADKMVYFTSATGASVLDFPSWARSFVSAASAAAGTQSLISALTQDTAPDVTADFVATSDASASTGKKVLLKNIFAAATAVGIGTSSPGYALHVLTGSGDHSIAIQNGGAGPTDTATLYASCSTTSVQASAYGSGDAYFIASASVALVVGNSANGATIFVQNNTERGRIDANGYLLWGYTSSNGAYRLQVNGQIFATSATIATSDGKYKRAVRDITGGLDIVSALRPVSFRWKEHPVHDFDLESDHVGFIAQEVRDALTGISWREGIVKSSRAKVERGGKDRAGRAMTDGLDEEFLGIAEGKMIPLLVAAIKELKARIEVLEARGQ